MWNLKRALPAWQDAAVDEAPSVPPAPLPFSGGKLPAEMSVRALRQAARELGVPVFGTKLELLQRLEDHLANPPAPSRITTAEDLECATLAGLCCVIPGRSVLCRQWRSSWSCCHLAIPLLAPEHTSCLACLGFLLFAPPLAGAWLCRPRQHPYQGMSCSSCT